MIRRKEEMKVDIRPEMMGGKGQFVIENILNADEMHGHGRLFAHGTLEPGHSVGYHVHTKDMEVCYFLSGTGIVVDENGVQTRVGPGNCNIVDVGHGHEVINDGTEPLTYIALILFA